MATDYSHIDRAIIKHCHDNPWQHPRRSSRVRFEALALLDSEGLPDWMIETRVRNTITRRLTRLRAEGEIDYSRSAKRWQPTIRGLALLD